MESGAKKYRSCFIFTHLLYEYNTIPPRPQIALANPLCLRHVAKTQRMPLVAGHLSQKSPIISGSLATNDMQLSQCHSVTVTRVDMVWLRLVGSTKL